MPNPNLVAAQKCVNSLHVLDDLYHSGGLRPEQLAALAGVMRSLEEIGQHVLQAQKRSDPNGTSGKG